MAVPKFDAQATSKPLKRFDAAHPMGRPWRRLRRQWLMQHPACALCALPAEEVHHVQPRCEAQNRTLDPTNLMSLCRHCHAEIHKK